MLSMTDALLKCTVLFQLTQNLSLLIIDYIFVTGNLEFLDQPTMAFVRLAEGKQFDNLVALPIPVRFVFVLLGPSTPDYNYHEIGRSISTLMADKVFE